MGLNPFNYKGTVELSPVMLSMLAAGLGDPLTILIRLETRATEEILNEGGFATLKEVKERMNFLFSAYHY